jgi:hypothetical protein
MAGTIIVPGTQTGWNITTYRKKAAPATYQEMVFIPMVEDYGMKPGTVGTVPKAARVASAVLAQTDTGETLTFSNMVDTAATLTAAGNYIAIEWSDNEDVQTINFKINTLASGEVTRAMGEGSDTIALQNVASLTNTMSQAGVDGTGHRQALGRLGQNTNGMAGPGKEQVYAVYSYTQLPNLGNIPEYNNAEIRGDSENPYVKGVWMRGGGVVLALSTAVYQDANGWHNPYFIREAFQVAWNTEKARVEEQRFNLATKVLCYNNFASGIVHNARALDFRTTASAL